MADILVADGTKEWHEILDAMLKKEGHRLSHGYDVKDAYSLLEKASFNLLIWDAFLPGVDWWEVYSSIKVSPSLSTMGVIITFPKMHLDDSGEHAKQVKIIIENGDGIIVKPFCMHDLIKAVSKVLSHYQRIIN